MKSISISHKLTRKVREKNQHRLEVLEVAEKLFASQGFHGTSIPDIAKAAEFSVGKIYTLFDCKEDIYISLLDMRGKEIYEIAKAAHSGGGTAWEKVKRSLINALEYLDSHKELVHIFIDQTAGFPSKIRSGVSEEFYEHYLKIIEISYQTYEEGVASGEFINADVEDLVIAMEGIIQMFCMHETLAHPEASLVPLAERILNVFASQLVRDPDDKTSE